tara:strand:+ start:302 stop:832 length:531 start_codon:yes stop_codon:yes gene_type:complete
MNNNLEKNKEAIYYLIANNGIISSDEHYRTSLIKDIKSDDVIIQFNTTVNFDFLKTIDCHHYLCMNKNGSRHIHGLKQYKYNRSFYEKVFVQNDVYKFVSKDLIKDDKLFIFPVTPYDFKTKKIPSVGYKFLRYLRDNQEIPLQNIRLVGFTFHGWEGHDWKNEKNECEKNVYLVE